MVTLEQMAYKGWPNCYRLSNGLVELIITTDVGPRLIHFGFIGQENSFGEFPEQSGLMGGEAWRLYGGHRLWHAPEQLPRTYYPDNQPVQIEMLHQMTRITQAVEPTTGLQKQLDIRMWENEAQVRIIHRLINHTMWPLELAPWALSVMAPAGKAIIPLPPKAGHEGNLLPTGRLALWPYTNLADPRWQFGREFIVLTQDPHQAEPQKIGLSCPAGWAGYWRDGQLFVKRFVPHPHGRYPDLGSMVELFTDNRILEVETLGPLTLVEPQDSVEHVETWALFQMVPAVENEADIQREIVPRVQFIRL